MVQIEKFESALKDLDRVLKDARSVLITAPGAADGDSIGSQLALQEMLWHRHPHLQVTILNDEPLPPRYLFLPDVDTVETPESMKEKKKSVQFDVGIVVDGGVDRAGRVKSNFDQCKCKVFIDHHKVSADYPYDIRIVEATASSTTELIFHLSQTTYFAMPINVNFAQEIYLGMIFDTGFFRHSNTTPELLELAAKLLRSGFDFTRVGERGLLERSFSSLQLMSDILSKSKLHAGGKIIYSVLTQGDLKKHNSHADDREGIIDHLFLTQGIEVAILFFEISPNSTKVSFRSHGTVDVAQFARGLTVRGGGHKKAAGASIEKNISDTVEFVLSELSQKV